MLPLAAAYFLPPGYEVAFTPLVTLGGVLALLTLGGLFTFAPAPGISLTDELATEVALIAAVGSAFLNQGRGSGAKWSPPSTFPPLALAALLALALAVTLAQYRSRSPIFTGSPRTCAGLGLQVSELPRRTPVRVSLHPVMKVIKAMSWIIWRITCLSNCP